MIPSKELIIGRKRPTGNRADFIDLSVYSHMQLFHATIMSAQYSLIICEPTSKDSFILPPLLRDIDWLSQVGGKIHFKNSTNNVFIESLIQRILSSRYEILTDGDDLVICKLADRDDSDIDNKYWSICLISGGRNEQRIERLIASIEKNTISDPELLVIGPKPEITLPPYAKHVPFEEDPIDPRYPISMKKNLAARIAKHNNLLILHDRFALSENWYAMVKQCRSDWDVLVFPMVIEHTNARLADWCAYRSLTGDTFKISSINEYYRTFPFNYKGMEIEILPYNKYSPFLMVNGGAFGVKKDVISEVPISPFLHWAEIEDSEWSQRLINNGCVISFAKNAVLESIDEGRHGSVPQMHLTAIIKRKLHLKARSVLFPLVQKGLDALNHRQDFFNSRGAFSKTVLPLSTENWENIKKIDWSKIEGIYIRNIFERLQSIREYLSDICAFVPMGKRVLIEHATTGFGYFRRSGHIRTCEYLCLEISTVLREHFRVRNIFCSAQNNYLIELERSTELKPFSLNSVLVLSEMSSLSPKADLFISEMADNYSVMKAKDSKTIERNPPDAVFVLRNMEKLGSAVNWKAIYKTYGNTCGKSESVLVLGGNLLLSYEFFRAGCGRFRYQDAKWFQSVFEENLILYGFYPRYESE